MSDLKKEIPTRSRSGKLSALEGLRGVAAMVVIISHLKITFCSSFHVPLSGVGGLVINRLLGGLTNGFFSVWLFWVMSGFVLSLKFHSEPDAAVAVLRLRDATIKRYPRLLPPVLASVLISWLLLASGGMSNAALGRSLGLDASGWPGQFFQFEPSLLGAIKGGGWQAFFIYDPSRSYNPVLWTMEKEFYGSLFLFAGLALFGKWRSRWLAYLLTIAVNQKLGLAWLNSFIVGGLLCDIYVNADRPRFRFESSVRRIFEWGSNNLYKTIAVVMVVLLGVGPPETGGDMTYLLCAIAMTVIVLWDVRAAQLFSSTSLVFLGKVSFGVYLMHLPIIFSVGAPLYESCVAIFSVTTAKLVASGILIILSLFAGWLLWYVVDRPAVAFAASLTSRREPS
jgi:peptidoglycan/LPS O-acetylase OafA/YrhL